MPKTLSKPQGVGRSEDNLPTAKSMAAPSVPKSTIPRPAPSHPLPTPPSRPPSPLPPCSPLATSCWPRHSLPTSIYDPASTSFNPTTALNAFCVRAVLLVNGAVLTADGNDDPPPSATAFLYDPSPATFGVTGSMTAPRANFTMPPFPMAAPGPAPSLPPARNS